mgnify:FL=1
MNTINVKLLLTLTFEGGDTQTTLSQEQMTELLDNLDNAINMQVNNIGLAPDELMTVDFLFTEVEK